MLQIENLKTFRGKVEVLHEISLTVENNQILTIIGANGAGKSTLLGTIAGLYRSHSGSITHDGEIINGLKPEQTVGKGLSLVPERRQIFADLTVQENLILGAYSRYRKHPGDKEKDIEKIYDMFPILRKTYKRIAGTLSGGEQQMLAIGRGLMARPKILMLDEPSLGLAPLIVREIMSILRQLCNQGTTILLVEQNARAAMKVADRVIVLERGRVVLEGKVVELEKDPRIQAAYIGKGYHIEKQTAKKQKEA